MDVRLDNLRLICDLDSFTLESLKTVLKDRNCRISGELQIPISSNKFNILMLIDSPSKNQIQNIPQVCSFSSKTKMFEEIKARAHFGNNQIRSTPIQVYNVFSQVLVTKHLSDDFLGTIKKISGHKISENLTVIFVLIGVELPWNKKLDNFGEIRIPVA